MKNLDGRVAVVTGAASGIGRASAVALARRGVRVVAADIDKAGVQALADEIGLTGKQAIGRECDVAQDDAFETLREEALSHFGRVDIVMNNVGVLTQGLPDQIPMEEWRRILEINLFSVIKSNAAFLPLLLEQGDGHIVNTASFAGLYTYAYDRMPYAASKAAIVQISEGLALYLRPKAIGVTCLCPGPVITNITQSIRSFGPKVETRGPGDSFRPLDAETVGEMVVEAIIKNRFMVPTHDSVRKRLVDRADDWDGFLKGQESRLTQQTPAKQ